MEAAQGAVQYADTGAGPGNGTNLSNNDPNNNTFGQMVSGIWHDAERDFSPSEIEANLSETWDDVKSDPVGTAVDAGLLALFHYANGGSFSFSSSAPEPTPTEEPAPSPTPVSVTEVNNTTNVTTSVDAAAAQNPLLRPGPYAGASIPAQSDAQTFTQAERDAINNIGYDTGCHTCGATDPGTSSGNFVPDHQPVSALNTTNAPQQLYPQCIDCSRQQGLVVARVLRQAMQPAK
jgi:hypothetical protein